jgi:hypothetical protein
MLRSIIDLFLQIICPATISSPFSGAGALRVVYAPQRTDSTIRQKFAVLISKRNFLDSESARFQRLSISIGRFSESSAAAASSAWVKKYRQCRLGSQPGEPIGDPRNRLSFLRCLHGKAFDEPRSRRMRAKNRQAASETVAAVCDERDHDLSRMIIRSEE